MSGLEVTVEGFDGADLSFCPGLPQLLHHLEMDKPFTQLNDLYVGMLHFPQLSIRQGWECLLRVHVFLYRLDHEVPGCVHWHKTYQDRTQNPQEDLDLFANGGWQLLLELRDDFLMSSVRFGVSQSAVQAPINESIGHALLA